MITDLLPFFVMVLGMVAVGITLAIVAIRRSIEDGQLPREYRRDFTQRVDAENSAGRGGGFQG